MIRRAMEASMQDIIIRVNGDVADPLERALEDSKKIDELEQRQRQAEKDELARAKRLSRLELGLPSLDGCASDDDSQPFRATDQMGSASGSGNADLALSLEPSRGSSSSSSSTLPGNQAHARPCKSDDHGHGQFEFDCHVAGLDDLAYKKRKFADLEVGLIPDSRSLKLIDKGREDVVMECSHGGQRHALGVDETVISRDSGTHSNSCSSKDHVHDKNYACRGTNGQTSPLKRKQGSDMVTTAGTLLGGIGHASASSQVAPDPCLQISCHPGLKDLVEMGFNEHEALMALNDAGGDINTAASMLLSASASDQHWPCSSADCGVAVSEAMHATLPKQKTLKM